MCCDNDVRFYRHDPTVFSVSDTSPIEQTDDALNVIVPKGATLEKIAGDFGFTEGPVWNHSGELLFTDINSARINVLASNGTISTFLGLANLTGSDASMAGIPGANGMTVDKMGRLTICDQGHRAVSRIEKGRPRNNHC